MSTLYSATSEDFEELDRRLAGAIPTCNDRPNILKFGRLLREVAALSKDPVKGVGSILLSPGRLKIIATGYNGLPFGMPDSEDLLDPAIKNFLMMHSELNLLANAAELGVCTSGGILLCTKYPCHICAGALVTAGVSHIITHKVSPDSDWLPSNKIANHIFTLAGVPVSFFDELGEP